MQIEDGFNLVNVAISAMPGQRKNLLDMISGVDNGKTNVLDITNSESEINIELGSLNSGSLINLDLPPVQMMNLNVAAQTYDANVGLLSRYRQWTEIKLELLG